jgi:hypothetical protein
MRDRTRQGAVSPRARASAAGAVATLGILLQGCATIMNGSMQRVYLRSDPPGADAVIGDVSVTTPAAVDLPRDRAHVVRFSLAGFEPVERHIHQRTSGYVLIDWIFGLLPALLDYSVGAAYDLEPALVEVRLNKEVR